MSKIEALLKEYEDYVNLLWQENLSGREKVWFCIYEPRDERRLRIHLPEFEQATEKSGHKWELVDITSSFEQWMCGNEYRDSYFANPKFLSPALDQFVDELREQIRSRVSAAEENTVVAVLGVGTLFGITRASTILEGVSGNIAGQRRLLVFFPGAHTENNYRLLDARDGWNYLAVPIEAGGNA